jgi:AcrR family transcriptional regulator
MKKVATRVGVTEAAIYRYFPTKDDLLLAIHSHFRDSFLVPLLRIAKQEELSPRDRLEAICQLNLKEHQRLKGMPILYLAEMIATGDEGILNVLQPVIREYHEMLAGLLDQAAGEGLSVQARELSILVMGIPAAFSLYCRFLEADDLASHISADLVPFMFDCVEKGRKD